jgi:multidrug efflux pump
LHSEKDVKHGRLYQWSERMFGGLLGGYRDSLTWVLDHPTLIMIVFVATLGLNVLLIAEIPKGFFPQQDTGVISGGMQGPQDASFALMRSALKQSVDAIKADPGVENVMGFTGGGGATNSANEFIALKPLNERRGRNATQIINELRPKLTRLTGANTYLQPVQDIRIGGRQSAAQYQYTLQAENPADLQKYGPQLLSALRKAPGFQDVNTDQQNNGLQALLTYDRPTAARVGLTPQIIDSTLYNAFGQSEVSTIYTQLNQYYVVMEVAPKYWQSPQGLDDVYLVPNSGGAVPMNTVTHYAAATSPLVVNHTGLFPSVTVSFNLAPGVSLDQASREIQQVRQGLNMPTTIHGQYSGTLQAFQQSLTTEPYLILTAVIAVYIVLGILYESLIHPLTILSTLPPASVGAILALQLTHSELDVMSIIGIILLIGIVKKNAIMMIDFALSAERNEGKSTRESIFEACTLRFRPILMTTMAAMFGAVPLAVGMGMGSELRRPLGISIIGGLLVSQVLTLYTTPVIYLLMDTLRLKIQGRRQRGGPVAEAAGLARG